MGELLFTDGSFDIFEGEGGLVFILAVFSPAFPDGVGHFFDAALDFGCAICYFVQG